ncbi:MAG: Smr/MutS family protein, partial [Clostridia bacterium]|nr:Smr/MutS family protein [Clostridia bacterium]
THYAELKAFALETEGVQNASCEFDVSTLRPTYRLVIGTPGKSNAFAISEKLGLEPFVVERAKSMVSSDAKRFEKVIERLAAARIAMEKAREEAEQMRLEYEKFKQKSEAELKERTKSAEEEVKKSLERARQILDGARATSDYILKELDDVRKKQESARYASELAAARQEIRGQLKKRDEEYAAFEYKEVDLNEEYVLPRALQVGDHVYLVSFGQEGEVLSLPDKDGNLTVKSGILKAKTHVSKVRLLGKTTTAKKEVRKAAVSKIRSGIADGFKPEIDVRGLTGDEAWWKIDKYIDDAYMAGVASVRIIHGKGTGALRAALWQFFRADKRVASYRQGAYGEGDAGVTILELK